MHAVMTILDRLACEKTEQMWNEHKGYCRDQSQSQTMIRWMKRNQLRNRQA